MRAATPLEKDARHTADTPCLIVYNDKTIDGRLSGELLRRACVERRHIINGLLPWHANMGTGFLNAAVDEIMDGPGEKYVYVADLGLPPELVRRIHTDDDTTLIWFENSLTSAAVTRAALDGLPAPAGDRHIGSGCCEMIWYFFWQNALIPAAVRTVSVAASGDGLAGVQEFARGLQLQDTTPGSGMWDLCLAKGAAGDAFRREVSAQGELLPHHPEPDGSLFAGEWGGKQVVGSFMTGVDDELAIRRWSPDTPHDLRLAVKIMPGPGWTQVYHITVWDIDDQQFHQHESETFNLQNGRIL